MNVKRIFGTLLTILGIIALLYAAYMFINGSEGYKLLAVYGILGLIFFIAGIGLVKNTKDEA
jgi:uncharacterized membrane protein